MNFYILKIPVIVHWGKIAIGLSKIDINIVTRDIQSDSLVIGPKYSGITFTRMN